MNNFRYHARPGAVEDLSITVKDTDRSIPKTITNTRNTRMSVPFFKLPTRVSHDGVIRLFSFLSNTLSDRGTSGGQSRVLIYPLPPMKPSEHGT